LTFFSIKSAFFGRETDEIFFIHRFSGFIFSFYPLSFSGNFAIPPIRSPEPLLVVFNQRAASRATLAQRPFLFRKYTGEKTMTSPAQLNANRANSQLSTGPTTEAGKHTVSQNSLRHGLSGSTHAALPGEEEAFAQYVRDYSNALTPVGPTETALAQTIASDRWRLKRAHHMENALFNQMAQEQLELDPATAQMQAWIDPTKGLQRIALYASRIQRAIERNTDELKALQSERKAAFAAAQEQAILLTQLAHLKRETYEPGADFEPASGHGGFAYSVPEIARVISRARRLEEARARFAPAA
jgi:hypothetical protein